MDVARSSGRLLTSEPKSSTCLRVRLRIGTTVGLPPGLKIAASTSNNGSPNGASGSFGFAFQRMAFVTRTVQPISALSGSTVGRSPGARPSLPSSSRSNARPRS